MFWISGIVGVMTKRERDKIIEVIQVITKIIEENKRDIFYYELEQKTVDDETSGGFNLVDMMKGVKWDEKFQKKIIEPLETYVKYLEKMYYSDGESSEPLSREDMIDMD